MKSWIKFCCASLYLTTVVFHSDTICGGLILAIELLISSDNFLKESLIHSSSLLLSSSNELLSITWLTQPYCANFCQKLHVIDELVSIKSFQLIPHPAPPASLTLASRFVLMSPSSVVSSVRTCDAIAEAVMFSLPIACTIASITICPSHSLRIADST